MFEFMIGDVFLNAAILCAILYLVAKHEADYIFAKVAMVTAVGTWWLGVTQTMCASSSRLLITMPFSSTGW